LLAAKEVLRFAGITALLPLRRMRRVDIPSGHQFRTPLRLRVLASFFALLPSMVAKRRAVSRSARKSRAEIAHELS